MKRRGKRKQKGRKLEEKESKNEKKTMKSGEKLKITASLRKEKQNADLGRI